MKRQTTSQDYHPVFEPLESRLLLSGDGLVDVDPGPVEPNGVVIRMLGIDNSTDAAKPTSPVIGVPGGAESNGNGPSPAIIIQLPPPGLPGIPSLPMRPRVMSNRGDWI